MSKKSIAFVMDTMNVGGVEKALIELLRAFDYVQYDVTLWLKNDNGLLQNQIDHHVKIKYWKCVDTKTVLKKQILTGEISGTIRGIFYRFLSRIHASEYELNALYSVKCLPPCSDDYYDCVIAYQVLSPAIVANALYRLNGKKKVLWVHGDHNRPKELTSFFSKIYNKFDKIYCVSKATLDNFCGQFPIIKNKADVFYNLIRTDRIIKLAEESIGEISFSYPIVTVGRLSPEKGQQMIPKTARLLLDAGYDFNWYLVGDGLLRGTIEAEIQKYDVADHVILLGTQTNPYPYIKNCDIYVQTSLSEGWCLTVQEARILQKPIVTTPLPVMHEQIISGENGLIAKAVTPEALAESIQLLLDHPELRKKFADNLSHEICDNSGELQKLYDFIES